MPATGCPAAELRRAGLDRFEPHLPRALDALGLGR
jgi:hypothetical protein